MTISTEFSPWLPRHSARSGRPFVPRLALPRIQVGVVGCLVRVGPFHMGNDLVRGRCDLLFAGLGVGVPTEFVHQTALSACSAAGSRAPGKTTTLRRLERPRMIQPLRSTGLRTKSAHSHIPLFPYSLSSLHLDRQAFCPVA